MINLQADKIESSRKAALKEIFDYLEQMRERLLGQQTCSQGIECDGMALGCLMKGLKALDILQPPRPPYENFSIRDVLGGLKNMQLPQYCKAKRGKGVTQSCEGFERLLMAKIQELENRFGVCVSE